MAWSHDLLTPDRQALLHVLAVFDGGFDLEQVERRGRSASRAAATGSTTSSTWPNTASSCPARRRPDGSASGCCARSGRSRSSGWPRIGRETEVRRRACRGLPRPRRTRSSRTSGTSQHGEWIDRIAPDQANLRAATRWAIDTGAGRPGPAPDGLVVADLACLRPGRRRRALTERRRSACRSPDVRAATAPGPRARPGASPTGRPTRRPRAGTTRPRSPWPRAADDEAAHRRRPTSTSATCCSSTGDAGLQRAFVDEVIARYRDLGDERGVARATMVVGHHRHGPRASRRGGRASSPTSLAEFERLDDRQYHAMTSASLGWVAFAPGDMATACRLAVEALVETQAMRDLGTTTISLHVGVLMAGDARSVRGRGPAPRGLRRACAPVRRPAAGRPRASSSADGTRSGTARAALGTGGVRGRSTSDGRRMTLDEAVGRVLEVSDASCGDVAAVRGAAGARRPADRSRRLSGWRPRAARYAASAM